MTVHLILLLHTAHNRRVLHQPFFPQDSIPSSHDHHLHPPSSYPNQPSSTSTSLSFFPDLPPTTTPHSPPSPASSSFPANISSESNSGSFKLVVVSVALAVSAVIIAVIALFLYLRRLRRRKRDGFSDSKTSLSSETSSRRYHANVGASANVLPVPRVSPPNSSEFLYLGTIVNSRGIDPRGFRNGGGRGIDRDTYLRKSDSPELRPLPPLGGQRFRKDHVKAELHEEDEEFHSPRESLGVRDNSTGTGSVSKRAFAAVIVENLTGRNSVSSSSYTSSSSDSPLRSVSLSISPQTSLSPKSLRPISPELTAMQKNPPPPQPETVVTEFTDFRSSPSNISNQNGHSPVRTDSTFSIPLFSDRNPRSQSLSSSSSSTDRPDVNIQYSSLSLSDPPPPPPYPVPAYPPPPPPYISAKLNLVSNLKAPSSSSSPLSMFPFEVPAPGSESTETTQKPKLKPLHWDKVRARSDREMVWDQLKSNSFKLNEEMIETLFVVKTTPTNNFNLKEVSTNQENRVLDPKKAQNIAISLRALNVTIEEVTDALQEGNAETLGTELLECLLKMAPSKEEERKLMEYNEEDDHSPLRLGQAERFLKEILHVPFAFKRMNVMLYVANFHSEIDYLNNSFQILEAACEELRTSRMFLKLLQAVLKTGNRMNMGTNRGDARAFKLDTLLKLVDVKAADGKTTLLHFVVQEMVRTEGAHLSSSNVSTMDEAKCRRLGLQVVSGINIELNNVKKAATMDSDILSSDVSKLTKGIENIVDVIRLNETTTGKVAEKSCQSFSESMSRFVKTAEEEMIRIRAQESLAVSLVKEVTEYFHGNSAKEEAHPFRIFVVVRDFLAILDRVCKEVGMIIERTPSTPWPEKNPHLHSHPSD